MARKIEGMASLKHLLRGLPDAANGEMADVLNKGSLDIQRAMVARTPRRRGGLQAGIKVRLSRANLTAQIGVVGPPAERRRLFYARILDLGRRAQVAKAVRKAPSGKVSRYLMRVRGIGAKRFVTGRFGDIRSTINARLRGVWDRIFARAGGGNG